MNYTALLILGMVLLAFLGLFVIPRFMLKRAMTRVIRIFREQHATSLKEAKTAGELGLRPRGLIEGMFRTRDYKPYALDLLRRSEIVVTTEEGKLYLSETKLSMSGMEARMKINKGI